LDETGLPLFHTQAAFRGTNGFLVASQPLLAMTIPLDRRTLAGGSQRWRNKGALQAFFQVSPKIACFAPSFSKQIFGGFVGFQWVTRLPNGL
jgi:hypothetical protein